MKQKGFKRVLLKITGEALRGNNEYGIDADAIKNVAEQLVEINNLGTQIGVVLGAGNIFRGIAGSYKGFNRVSGDYIGMLATLINSLALQDSIEALGAKVRVMSAIEITRIAETYVRRKAISYLNKGNIIIFACGTGNPFFTTDTAAALRAEEVDAEVVLKGTKVDGVYSDDPMKNKGAKLYTELTFMEVLNKGLKVMDATAISLCKETNMPIIVFNIQTKGNLKRVVLGEKIGTIVRG